MKSLTLIALAAALLAAPAAQAKAPGVYKVGDTFEVRLDGLDLNQTKGRQVALRQIDRATAKLCAGQRIKARKQSCMAETTQTALANASPALRQAVQLARMERDGVQQASR
jgi:UrcA family protein